MTKRFSVIEGECDVYDDENYHNIVCRTDFKEDAINVCKLLNTLNNENEQLKKDNEYFQELLDRYEIKTNDFDRFMNNREHTRLSINLETGKLQRHIYATGNWFGDFDRVLVTNWLDEESYHRFIDRVIEVFNTEFKKELKDGDVE